MPDCAEIVLDSTATGGDLRCVLRPDLGGCVAGLWWRGQPVLREPPPQGLAEARQSGAYPLVPFSNRIGHAVLQWQGSGHPLLRNNAPEPHAIHGVAWQRPWQVLEQGPQHALLGFEHAADAAWPFAFDASQSLRLSGNTLELVLGLTNQSERPAPGGLGWHPWFVKRAGAHLAFEAGARWEMDADQLPTRRNPSSGVHADLAGLVLDHCFEDWRGQATLRDPVMTVRLHSRTPYLVVCTQPARAAVAIEPVSHANNAINLQHARGRPAAELGVRTLAPGESMTLQISLEIGCDEAAGAAA